jgi:hypothetical protein
MPSVVNQQPRSLGAAGNLVQPEIHWSSRKFGPAGNSLVQSEIWSSRKFIGLAGNLVQPEIRGCELVFVCCENMP